MSKTATSRAGTLVIAIGAVVLAIVHQDLWLWDDRSIVLGFLPIGLAYHAGFSIAAAALWALALMIAWPSHIEAWAEGREQEGEEDTEGNHS